MKKLETMSKKFISNFILEEVREIESDFWIITVTWVKISPDLSYLDVFVSSLKNWQTLPKALAYYGFHLQKKLNKYLDIRKLPKIRFRYNDEWEFSQHVTMKINETLKNIDLNTN
jgi:ribosome-binding factor A